MNLKMDSLSDRLITLEGQDTVATDQDSTTGEPATPLQEALPPEEPPQDHAASDGETDTAAQGSPEEQQQDQDPEPTVPPTPEQEQTPEPATVRSQPTPAPVRPGICGRSPPRSKTSY